MKQLNTKRQCLEGRPAQPPGVLTSIGVIVRRLDPGK